MAGGTTRKLWSRGTKNSTAIGVQPSPSASWTGGAPAGGTDDQGIVSYLVAQRLASNREGVGVGGKSVHLATAKYFPTINPCSIGWHAQL
eukprot:6200531-Pyramimonas_sp.AAC.1